MTSKPSSKIGAFFHHLPKAYRALVTTSTLLVACSLALFVFAVPPVLGEQSDGQFQNPLFGSADNQTPPEATDAGSDAAGAANTPGVASVIGAGVSAIGAAGPGGVTAPGASAPAESGEPAHSPGSAVQHRRVSLYPSSRPLAIAPRRIRE